MFQNLDCGARHIYADTGGNSAVYAALLPAHRNQRLGAVLPFALWDTVVSSAGFQVGGAAAGVLDPPGHGHGVLVLLPAHVDLFRSDPSHRCSGLMRGRHYSLSSYRALHGRTSSAARCAAG